MPGRSTGAAGGGFGKPEPSPSPPPAPEDLAREFCLAALERRMHSRRELELKLLRKRIPEEAAAAVLDRLTEVGLVDDEAFARAFVLSRQRRRPRGTRALRAELAARGVARDVTERVLSELGEEEDPVESALRALRPRLAGYARLDPANARGKAAQFLTRRGFEYTVVEAALRHAFP